MTITIGDKCKNASKILGPCGAIISGSKSGYVERNPDNLAVFNSNICTEEGKIWWGDLDVTLSQSKLSDLAFEIEEDIYVLYEMDGRFENESSPKIGNFVAKFFYDGGFELSEWTSRHYDTKITRKKS